MKYLILVSLLFSALVPTVAHASPPDFNPDIKMPGFSQAQKLHFVKAIRDAASGAINRFADKANLVIRDGTPVPIRTFQCVCWTMASSVAALQNFPPDIQSEFEVNRKKWCDDDNSEDPTRGKTIMALASADYASRHGMNKGVPPGLKDKVKVLDAGKRWGAAQVAAVAAVITAVAAEVKVMGAAAVGALEPAGLVFPILNPELFDPRRPRDTSL